MIGNNNFNKIRTFFMAKGAVRYLKNTSWMLAEQILRMISGVLVGIWVARYLGPNQFGIFSYSIAYVGIFSGIAKLGLDSIVIRNLVSDTKNELMYLGTAFRLKLLGALIMFVITVSITYMLSSDSETNFYISIISAGIIFQSFEVIEFYFQSKVLSKFSSISKLVQLLVSALVKIFLILIQADLVYFVWVTVLDQISLSLILYFIYSRKNKLSFYLHFNRKIAKSLLIDSWPLLISGMAIAIYMRIDQVMIKHMLGDHDAGIYTAAIRLSEVWYFIPVVVTSSLIPAIVSAKKISNELYLSRLQNLSSFMTLSAFLLAIIISFLSSDIVIFLYGEAFLEAGKVLSVQIWGAIFVFAGIVGNAFLTTENLTKVLLLRTSVGAVLNVALNLYTIPYYGVIGAAISTVVSQFVTNFLFDLIDKRTMVIFKIKIRSLIFKFSKV